MCCYESLKSSCVQWNAAALKPPYAMRAGVWRANAGRCGAGGSPPFNLSARLLPTEEGLADPLRAHPSPKRAVFECFWVFYTTNPGVWDVPQRLFQWLGAENGV